MPPGDRRTHIIGVDLGATKILAGAFDARLRPLGTVKISTNAHRGAATVMDRIARGVLDAIDEVGLSRRQVRGVGIGAPGAVDPDKGTVVFAPNLDWRNVALVRGLRRRLRLPILLENDCRACMLGIYDQELKRKPANVVGLFIGTGIGGGLVINGTPYLGSTHTAGEVGHMVIDVNGPRCKCGNRGCFEMLAGRLAIFRAIKEAIRAGHKTVLTEMLGKSLKDMRSGHLRKAIRRGDETVRKIVENAAGHIGVAVGNLANSLNPDVVVLGGGVIEALVDEIMPGILRSAKDHVLPGTSQKLKIFPTRLADHAGITGAAVLVRDRLP